MILRPELSRAVVALEPDPRAITNAHIPDTLLMACGLMAQMRRPRVGHSGYHRVIFSGLSKAVSAVVDGESRTMIEVPPVRTSTSAAPVCLAALIARAISACVNAGFRRCIVDFSNKKAPPKRG